MRNVLTAVTVGVATSLMLVAASPARAGGGYVGLGIGGTATIGDYDRYDSTGTTGRLTIGQRFGKFALEASFGGYSLSDDNLEDAEYKVWALSVGGKLNLAVAKRLDLTVRAGVERNWLSGQDARHLDRDGDGWYGGIGAEFPLSIGVVNGALFADVTRHEADIDPTRHLATTQLMLGVLVGF